MPIGELESPGAIGNRCGKCAFDVAEQLAFDESCAEGTARRPQVPMVSNLAYLVENSQLNHHRFATLASRWSVSRRSAAWTASGCTQGMKWL